MFLQVLGCTTLACNSQEVNHKGRLAPEPNAVCKKYMVAIVVVVVVVVVVIVDSGVLLICDISNATIAAVRVEIL